MRILNITDRIPFPTTDGAPLHSFNFLKRIARQHEIWLIAFVETPEQLKGVQYLQKFCYKVEVVGIKLSSSLAQPLNFLRYMLSGKPPDFRFSYSEELANKIRNIVSAVKFDIVLIEHSDMGLYLENIPLTMRNKTVWSLHDVDWIRYARISRIESKLARKFRLWLHSKMVRRWQPRYAERFARCFTVSETDRRALITANPRLHVDVIPGGVDTYFNQPLPQESTLPTLIFVGNMDYSPNADAMLYFCNEILPLIKRIIPEVELWIVGGNPRPEVKQLDGNGVHVTGWVDDVRPYYKKSTVSVVPLRAGGGARLKIREAMALNRVVVSTSLGCEGQDVIDGEHLFIADSPHKFAETTVRLIKNETLRKRVAVKARKFVVVNYDWDVVTKKLLQIFAKMSG